MTTMLDRAEALFRARPGEWIDGREIADVAGCYASRTRISELRTKRGMVIENRLRRLKTSTRYTVSEYRWVPAPTVQELDDLLGVAQS